MHYDPQHTCDRSQATRGHFLSKSGKVGNVRAHSNRRQRSGKYSTMKDTRFQNSPSWSFGGRHGDELDTLASNNAFFRGGTHRCPQGEELLDPLRRRDDKSIEELTKQGRQWKAVPGPGTYRSPSCVGNPMGVGGRDRTDLSMGNIQHNKTPSWSLGLTARRPKTYHTLGDLPLVQHEGPLRPPTPSAKKTLAEKGLVPGPGNYFKRCNSAPSAFSDFHRPQGISLEAP